MSNHPLIRSILSEFSLESASFSGQMKIALVELLPTGRCSADAVARKMGISSRTLRRRLNEEKTSFNEELLQLRIILAERYLLHSELASQEISKLLGYDVPTSFNRFFKAATGMTPQELRKNQGSNKQYNDND